MSSVIDQTMPVKQKKKTPVQLGTRVIPLDRFYFTCLYQPKLVICCVVARRPIQPRQFLTVYPLLELFHRIGREFVTKVEFEELIQHHVIVRHAKIQHCLVIHYDLRGLYPRKVSTAAQGVVHVQRYGPAVNVKHDKSPSSI